MKYHIVVITPLGTFEGVSKEGTEAEVDHAESLLGSKLTHVSFKDVKGNTIIIKNECLARSIIKINRDAQ